MKPTTHAALTALLVFAAGCGPGGAGLGTGGAGPTPTPTPNNGPGDPDGLGGLPTGPAQLALLCARGNADTISKAFCGATAPTITSLTDLQKVIGVAFVPGVLQNAHGGNPAFSLTGNSSSLVVRLTSAINPRVIAMTPNGEGGGVTTPVPLPNFVAFSYVRGEEFSELAAQDPTANTLRFFLFRFEHACDTSATGCGPGDLLTPAVESGFTAWSLYEDLDLRDTKVDCLQCHQPGGPGKAKVLRMPERVAPWEHWFEGVGAATGTEGQLLLSDFQAAHGTTEDYGGVPAALIPLSKPQYVEGATENQSGLTEPNQFPSATIQNEVIASNPQQPSTNVPPGISATWQGLYANFVAGNAIPVPYHDEKVTDPAKLASMTAAYTAFRNGTQPASTLPDITQVMLDAALTDMGIRPAAGSTGQSILVQMCHQCHNSTLDQTISRARFNVDTLSTLSTAEKQEAIRRLGLPDTDSLHMPPRRFHELSPAEVALVTQVLSN